MFRRQSPILFFSLNYVFFVFVTLVGSIGLKLQKAEAQATQGNVVLYTDSIAVLKHTVTAFPDARGMASIRLPRGTMAGTVIVQPMNGGGSVLPLLFKNIEGIAPVVTSANYLYSQRGQRATVDLTEGGESTTYTGLLEVGSPEADFITIRNERGAQIIPLARVDHVEITSPIATPKVREKPYTEVSFQTQGSTPISFTVSYAVKGTGWMPSIKAFKDASAKAVDTSRFFEADEYYRAVVFSAEEMPVGLIYNGITRRYLGTGYFEGMTFGLGELNLKSGEENKVEFAAKQRRRFMRVDTANIIASPTVHDTAWPIKTYYIGWGLNIGLSGMLYELYLTEKSPDFYTMVSAGDVFNTNIVLEEPTFNYLSIHFIPTKKKGKMQLTGQSKLTCNISLFAPKGYTFTEKDKKSFRFYEDIKIEASKPDEFFLWDYELHRDE